MAKKSKTKKSQSAAKQYEKKVESNRERGIRQSQSGSKYDKQVSNYAQEKGFGKSFSEKQASGSDKGLSGKSGATKEFERRKGQEGWILRCSPH